MLVVEVHPSRSRLARSLATVILQRFASDMRLVSWKASLGRQYFP